MQTTVVAQSDSVFQGASVDLAAVYRTSKLKAEELDRVARAEGLLHLLPSKASHTREIVDATFHAFGVDRSTIVDAATKQLDALERFIRFSQDQTQAVLDVGAKRIAELESEIERSRRASTQATNEGEERARTVNNEMVKVQRVLEFFGSDSELSDSDIDLGGSTGLTKPDVDVARAAPPTPSSAASPRQRPNG